MTTTRLAVEQLLSEQIGDFLEFDSSSTIVAGTSITASALLSYDGGQDDYFNTWWLSFTEGVNYAAGFSYRQISDYSSTAGGKLYFRGSAGTAESAQVTLRLHRFNPNNKWLAINRSIEQLYPTLYKPIDNQILVTGNILPNAHFEDWASTANPDFFAGSAAAMSAISIAGSIRGGSAAVRVTPSGTTGNGYMYLSSKAYPPLLDLNNRTVNFYAWAYPEVANDPSLIIYTKDMAGSTQTLSSTTAAGAGRWTLLSFENQVLNDDLVEVELRFNVASSAKYTYFDDAILCGRMEREYCLPAELQDGVVSKVRLQSLGVTSTNIPKACYELQPRYYAAPETFDVIKEGDYSPTSVLPVYKRLRLYESPASYYRMRIEGMAPIPTLSSDTATIYLDGGKLNLIAIKAGIELYEIEQGSVSSQDKGRYYSEIARLQDKYRRVVSSQGMIRPS